MHRTCAQRRELGVVEGRGVHAAAVALPRAGRLLPEEALHRVHTSAISTSGQPASRAASAVTDWTEHQSIPLCCTTTLEHGGVISGRAIRPRCCNACKCMSIRPRLHPAPSSWSQRLLWAAIKHGGARLQLVAGGVAGADRQLRLEAGPQAAPVSQHVEAAATAGLLCHSIRRRAPLEVRQARLWACTHGVQDC